MGGDGQASPTITGERGTHAQPLCRCRGVMPRWRGVERVQSRARPTRGAEVVARCGEETEHGAQSLPPVAEGHGRPIISPAAPVRPVLSSRFPYLLNWTYRSSKTCADSPYFHARWWHNRHTHLPDFRCDALRIPDAHRAHRGECHISRISSP